MSEVTQLISHHNGYPNRVYMVVQGWTEDKFQKTAYLKNGQPNLGKKS